MHVHVNIRCVRASICWTTGQTCWLDWPFSIRCFGNNVFLSCSSAPLLNENQNIPVAGTSNHSVTVIIFAICVRLISLISAFGVGIPFTLVWSYVCTFQPSLIQIYCTIIPWHGTTKIALSTLNFYHKNKYETLTYTNVVQISRWTIHTFLVWIPYFDNRN